MPCDVMNAVWYSGVNHLIAMYRLDIAIVSWFHNVIIELFDMLLHEQREVSVDLSGIVSNCK